VHAYCETKAQDPPNGSNEALRLGRAALTIGAPEIALTLLKAAYPATDHNDVQVIGPAYLATFAQAKFRAGRRYQNQVLSHLSALLDAYPITSVVYDLAQGYFIPERREGNVR
jgi:hypothetical protein